MTNRELLNTPRERLSGLEKQLQFHLKMQQTAVPCPACDEPVDAVKAAGIDVNAYSFGREKLSFYCPCCRAELEQVFALVGTGSPGWHWKLNRDWLADRLRKARLFDREHPEVLP